MFRNRLVAFVVAVLAGGSIAHAQDSGRLTANRIILRVADLKKSIGFYRDLVGLPVQSTFEEFAVLDGGGGVTVMLQHITSTLASQPNAGLSSLTEVVLESTDILASYQAMKGRGIVFRLEPRVVTVDSGRDLYAADFRDPDGHVLSITGWVDAPPKSILR
jgi:catechol 2,3-dioxygenase-like lactoylglutathione lyase family enzyme